MGSIGVTVLTEILANIVAEPEMFGMDGVHFHPTSRTPVALQSKFSLQIPEGERAREIKKTTVVVDGDIFWTDLFGCLM